jgi:hypothetical protein
MTCRYCLEEDGEFVSPCRCRGSVGFVHEECLNKWIQTIDSEREAHCPICLTHIKTNHTVENYLFKKKDPLNKNEFYWWVLLQLGFGILISRADPELMHTLYINMQVGIYIGYYSFIWYWFYKLENKKLFLKQYFLPGPFIVGFTHTYVLMYVYAFSRTIDLLVINWLFCVAHLLYPINIREMNTALDKVNNEINRMPRRWIR